MKKILFIFLLLPVAQFCQAQHVPAKKVPAIVVNTFTENHPEVKKVKWSKDATGFEASFSNDGFDASVSLNPDGKILETENEIAVADLPPAILIYLEKNYTGKKIKEAAIIKDSTQLITYEVEINKSDLIFDKTGQLLKTINNK